VGLAIRQQRSFGVEPQDPHSALDLRPRLHDGLPNLTHSQFGDVLSGRGQGSRSTEKGLGTFRG
jgi:hypothetical protein